MRRMIFEHRLQYALTYYGNMADATSCPVPGPTGNQTEPFVRKRLLWIRIPSGGSV
ncbi:hypothetical protein RHD99_13470 [Buttiauxella selenatireducens]|uniref:Uncharacterized protein n=1 Tax=Buttiauxella selenatireducens TaxID=3073902 RepID=A0ABY9S6B6_9ENTR|nr:hypothetical protein [Buttiauxella sp. R73]WMY72495.1 hypothetical protein RHD99_13470 [Buttiauxella sp. R73]